MQDYSSYPTDGFFSGESLTLQDFTNDDVPEILFTEGFAGASDYVSYFHALKYDPKTNTLNDIREKDFYVTGLTRTQFIKIDNSIYVLIAKGDWAESESHYETHFYNYILLKWDEEKNKFSIIDSNKSSQKFEDPDKALEDWFGRYPEAGIL